MVLNFKKILIASHSNKLGWSYKLLLTLTCVHACRSLFLFFFFVKYSLIHLNTDFKLVLTFPKIVLTKRNTIYWLLYQAEPTTCCNTAFAQLLTQPRRNKQIDICFSHKYPYNFHSICPTKKKKTRIHKLKFIQILPNNSAPTIRSPTFLQRFLVCLTSKLTH